MEFGCGPYRRLVHDKLDANECPRDPDVTDLRYRADLAPIREKYLGKKGPASTLVEIRALAHPDWMIEIEAIAVV